MKTTPIRNCQSCGVEFIPNDIAYYVPIDNNIVCFRCSLKHDKSEKRLVEIEHTCNPVTARYDVLVGILLDGGVEVTPEYNAFLRWISKWDDNTVNSLRGLLEKCLKVGGKDES